MNVNETSKPALPPWADENLFTDECALLSDGVDWANPVHVLLLRLARERAGYRYVREQLRMLEPPQSPLSAETIAWAREVAAKHEEEEAAIPKHECRWEMSPESPMKFPQMRCPVCGSGTQFFGALYPGSDGTDGAINGPVLDPQRRGRTE